MNWIKNSIGRIDPLKVMVYAIIIALCSLIIAVYGLSMKVSDLSHENEKLVAQKEVCSLIIDKCGNRESISIARFKYDPNTGSIYDNETKEIYRKVTDYKGFWEEVKPTIPSVTIDISSGVETSVHHPFESVIVDLDEIAKYPEGIITDQYGVRYGIVNGGRVKLSQ
jgi:hypothetical protein